MGKAWLKTFHHVKIKSEPNFCKIQQIGPEKLVQQVYIYTLFLSHEMLLTMTLPFTLWFSITIAL